MFLNKYSNIYFEISKILKYIYIIIFLYIYSIWLLNRGQYLYKWLWTQGTNFWSRRRIKIFTGVGPQPITTLNNLMNLLTSLNLLKLMKIRILIMFSPLIPNEKEINNISMDELYKRKTIMGLKWMSCLVINARIM